MGGSGDNQRSCGPPVFLIYVNGRRNATGQDLCDALTIRLTSNSHRAPHRREASCLHQCRVVHEDRVNPDKRTLECNLLPLRPTQGRHGRPSLPRLRAPPEAVSEVAVPGRESEHRGPGSRHDLLRADAGPQLGYVRRNEARHVTRLETEKPDHVWLGAAQEADAQLGERLEKLKEQARRGVRPAEDWKLKEFAQEHLEHRADEVADKTWNEDERALGYLTAYPRRECTRTPRLSDVTARRLEGFLRYRNRRVKASSAHHELASISAMLKRARRWGVLGRNEARNVERLTEEKPDTNWLEVAEAAKVIKAARQMVQNPASRCRPHFHALIATFLLTRGAAVRGIGADTGSGGSGR